MKKYIIIMCLLALLATSDDVKPADDVCTCVKLMSENDCIANTECTWIPGTPASGTTAATQGSCALTVTQPPPRVLTFCSTVTDPAAKCASTSGCAYVESTCAQFTSCTAYVKTTNADCQAISTLCITDGTQCTDAKSCNEYNTQTACTANPSISGTKQCKWDNGICRDYVCTEAASSLTTDSDCSAWLFGCVTTGKGCIQVLGACSSYTGDDVTCSGLKGTDGNCEGVTNGTTCRTRTCANASNSLIIDADCSLYQAGCVTSGKGCVTAPLPACSSYSGDSTTCVGYKGSDGFCEGDAGATNCRARNCSNAPTSNNTDSLCNDYKSGCVTTGKGCITVKGACSSYQGTTSTCEGLVGTDGNCKGTNATTIQACVPKTCADAPPSSSTDNVCQTYQTNCKTTGRGCVNSLGLCSSYTGGTCDGLVGSDGKCKADPNNAQNCVAKVCSDAPSTYQSNSSCADFQIGCVTNGAGCVSQTSCISTIKQVSCSGTQDCRWNSICVASTYCSDFLTVSICSGNNAISGSTSTPCYWTGSSCRNLACTDAPSTMDTDSKCGQFLQGCWTKGNGCLAQSEPCSSYQGNQATCSNFLRKCWNILTATSTTTCTDRTCADDTTSTSDDACNTFKSGCKTKGTGCIDQNQPCTSYSGIQSDCDKFKGRGGADRCWNTIAATSTTACTVKTCTDNTNATSNDACGHFLNGCVTNGSGCISSDSTCSSYTGTQAQCDQFKGNNGNDRCWYPSTSGSGTCVKKECSHAPTSYALTSDCERFLTGCLTNGSGCVSRSTPCSSYTGDLTKCITFTGNSQKCYKDDSCGDRACADKPSAADNNECTSYLSTCRYFKGGCVNAGICTTYEGASLAECQDVLDNSRTPKKCWWETGGNTCIARACNNAPNTVTNQADCDNHLAGCMYNGNNQCVVKGTCSGYTAPGSDDSARLNNCKVMTNTSGKACWFISGASTCTDRTCANVLTTPSRQQDCDNHKSDCLYNGNGACITKGACSSYTVSGSNNAQLLANCQALINTNNQACFWTTGTTCEEKTCTNAVAPANQNGCDAHLPSSCLYKPSSCDRVCTGKTRATSQIDCTNYLTDCQWLGGSSCATKPANCAGVNLSEASSESKQAVCEGVSTVAGVACQLDNSRTACEDRICSKATGMTNTSTCGDWLTTCQWDGANSCVTQDPACPSSFYSVQDTSTKQKDFCNNYITSTSSGKCQVNGSTGCVARTCDGATGMTSTNTCGDWLTTCQWDGANSCVISDAACPLTFESNVQNTPDKQEKFCNNYTTRSSGKCQVGTSGCVTRANCAGATGMTSTNTCSDWLTNCQWDGASSCVDQDTACPSFFNSSVQDTSTKQKDFCNNYITSTSSGKCQVNGSTGCVARTCDGATGMTSTNTCRDWLTNCQWDGISGCVDQTNSCPPFGFLVQNTSQKKEKFCNNFTTSSSSGKCQVGTSGCEARTTCAGATGMTSASACSDWLPNSNCQWDGISSCVDQANTCPSTVDQEKYVGGRGLFCNNYTTSSSEKCQVGGLGCVTRASCAGATGMTSASACSDWLPNCQWNGGRSCVDQDATCPLTFDPNLQQSTFVQIDFCNNYTTSSSGKCQVGTSGCVARADCAGANLMTSASACSDWLPNCQWDGLGGCVPQTDTCPQTLSSLLYDTTEKKKNFCNNYTTSSSGKCLVGTSGCVARTTCAQATEKTSANACSDWLPNCQWDGANGCVNQATTCPSTFDSSVQNTTEKQENFCNNYTTSSSGKCQVGTSGCVARASCAGATRMTSASTCSDWLPNCQWNGGGSCVDQEATCPLTFDPNVQNATYSQVQFCNNYTTSSSGKCQVGTSGCVVRTTCAAATGMTSASTCNAWLPNCQWDGISSCVPQTATCPTAFGKHVQDTSTKQEIFCNNYTTSSSGKCQVSYDRCLARTCAGATEKTSANACSDWLPNCQWDGANGCVNQATTCPSTFDSSVQNTTEKQENFCNNYTTSSSGKCQVNGSTGCVARTSCALATGRIDTSECSDWLATCQWNGFRSCVDQDTTCPSTFDSSVQDTSAQQKAFCNNYTTSSSGKCQVNGSTGCAARTCAGATEMTDTSTCSDWLTNCQWDGANGCVNQATTCPSTFDSSVQNTTAKQKDFCNNYTTSSSGKCQVDGSTGCVARTCAGATEKTSANACSDWLTNCQWDGANGCVNQATTCPSTFDSSVQNTTAKQKDFCNNYITSTSSGKCQADGSTGCVARTCAGATEKTSDNACSDWLTNCQWDGANGCVNEANTCSTSQGECVSRTCSNAVNPTSTADCSNWRSTCVYTGAGCVPKAISCVSYTPTGADNNAKRTICTGLTSTDSDCVYIDNSITCANKACRNVYPTVTKRTCEAWLTSCRYVGTICLPAAACDAINIVGTTDSEKATFCSGIKDNSTTPIACIYDSAASSTFCSSRTCRNIPTPPANDTDCTNHLSTCRLSYTIVPSCVADSTPCSGYQGTADQCKTFTGAAGRCWSNSTTLTPDACIDRQCTHNTTATTDRDCNDFLSGCKTNGAGCVPGSTTCSTFTGNANTCLVRKASDNTNFCKYGTSVEGPCKDKSCYDDASSTTDRDCLRFLENCVTKGVGCIPKSEPCTSYRGTQQTCALFKGSYGAKICWNTTDATDTTACVNKTCSDDTTSMSDQACGAIGNCVTKGHGCIAKSSPCSAYSGNKQTCEQFKGNNGYTQCSNLESATSSTVCIDKTCTLNTTATTDVDCDTFFPRDPGASSPRCITNGSGCVTSPKICSYFTGTTEQCSRFTASDGPCKSSVTTGSGSCTPRVCSEALNTNDTDQKCQHYHPTCSTTGHGCAITNQVSCSNVTDQNACAAKSGCSWANNCRKVESDCSAFTSSGASICVNTPLTSGTGKCAWYNNACRALTCQDLSDQYRTDDACKTQLSTCTTKGDGCITKGACSTYLAETICKAAKTTDVGDTCIWDSTVCRAKRCADATIGITTDDGCNNFLAGCKTSGTTCINEVPNCASLVTSTACKKDGSNRPCLWVNSVCHNYSKCEDIAMRTHTDCQQFSSFCTTDGQRCIGIKTCAGTSLQASCIIGTDGTCGWLPAVGAQAAKCQKFGVCSDAVSDSQINCAAYGSNCITDGTKCVTKGTCNTYTTQIACDTGGTDGICVYSQNACRLRECSDANASNASSITTHSGCNSFVAKTSCTTNGTSCIAFSTCSSFTVEVGCQQGTDGICTWALPVGTTTSTIKSCRLKVCQDFTLITSATCSTALTGTGCVSNGTNCIAKSTCSTYTNKEACNGGGTDGLCAFTSGSTITPAVGTCKLMTACSDANNDSIACGAKSAACDWKVTTSGSTLVSACNAHNCSTKSAGSECNPVPSFDQSTYSICIPSSTGCVLGGGTSLTSASCYGKSARTYTWNTQANACQACFTRNVNPNPSDVEITGSTYGALLNTLAILLVLATMVA